MGTAKKGATPAGPSRRTVLLTALAAGAGVATTRVLGMRNLGGSTPTEALGAMAMATDPTGMSGAPMEELVMEIPDDSFFGPQNLDGSVLPELVRPAASLPPVSAPRSVTSANTAAAGTLQPPISGITPPRLSSDLDWVSPLASEAARVTHLLRRATFGYTDAELDRALSDGYQRTVDRLIDTPFVEPPTFVRPQAAATPRPSVSPRPSASASATPMPSPTSSAMPAATPAPITNQTQINIGNLQSWWIDWMTQTPTPFAEKMTLFWHGHFTSDYRKVGTSSPAMYLQNLAWRRMAMTDLKTMLMEVTPDLAMLRYLDLGASTGRNPNENYARELLELFTLGVGNYSEDDVKAASKALAGWRLPQRTEPTLLKGVFDPRRAYTGSVTFLGKTGTFDTAAVMDQILAQDAAAAFIARDLARFFVSPGVSDAYVARLADTFRRSKYDMKSLMRSMLMSPEFTAPDAYRALIKSPTEFMVSSAKALGAPSGSAQMIRGYGSVLGQTLFDPPSVAGWGDNASWISSNTMLQRANFASQLIASLRTLPTAARAHERHLDAVLGPGTVQELNNARDDRSRWFAVLASPEFQLK